MTTFEKINNEITNWTNTFDKLVKHFTNDDYYIIMAETNFSEEDMECYEEAYNSGNWDECMKIYLGVLLKDCINMSVKFGTDNIFRLWYETV